MDLLVTLGRTLGFSLAAGLNLYATVAIIGLAARYDWVELPPQFAIFNNDWVIGLALLLYAVEFVADKVPWVDTIWDGIHTAVRPLGGALIAVATLGEASPTAQGVVALLGAMTAGGSHLTKAGTRAFVNATPEPFSNWVLSLVEDLFVVTLGYLALQHPLIALVVCVVALVAVIALVTKIVRVVKGRMRGKGSSQGSGPKAQRPTPLS